eukprot:scaffold1854_cov51-Skeletonema_menzelii.AAC.1
MDYGIRWPLPTIGIREVRGGLQEIVIIGSPDYSTLIGTHVRVEERRSGHPAVGFLMRSGPREIGLNLKRTEC